MPIEYKHLTPEERQHFLEHGWLKVPGAIKQKYINEWMADLWTRLGWDENDKSTWAEPYLKMPRHREVPTSEFCPEAWAKMCELVGGEHRIDPVRERYYGDQFIVNFGTADLVGKTDNPAEAPGWHTDDDWYRMFLDSSGNALTIIHLFTDVPEGGGGTYFAEDGIKGICEILYDNPQGFDPPEEKKAYVRIKESKVFGQIVGKAGDVFITHGLLPHTAAPNHLHYARVISNPHVNLVEPHNLNRPDGDYTMCEQVILRALGRESIPEWHPTRERMVHYPRTAYFKRERIKGELQRMVEAAKAKGLGPESVDSVYLKGEEAIKEHERRNGYDQDFSPFGVLTGHFIQDRYQPGTKRHVVT